jgi:hypothetical protein
MKVEGDVLIYFLSETERMCQLPVPVLFTIPICPLLFVAICYYACPVCPVYPGYNLTCSTCFVLLCPVLPDLSYLACFVPFRLFCPVLSWPS